MKLVILDRDGVINEDSDAYIKSPAEWIPIPGSLEAIARLNNEGYAVAVATNQSGLARGFFDVDVLNSIHALMCSRAAAVGARIETVAFCPHGPSDGCQCRKPAPGLLLALARRFGTSLAGVPMIGDSLRDLESAAAVGARGILVKTGNGEKTRLSLPRAFSETPVFDDLAAAVEALVR